MAVYFSDRDISIAGPQRLTYWFTSSTYLNLSYNLLIIRFCQNLNVLFTNYITEICKCENKVLKAVKKYTIGVTVSHKITDVHK